AAAARNLLEVDALEGLLGEQRQKGIDDLLARRSVAGPRPGGGGTKFALAGHDATPHCDSADACSSLESRPTSGPFQGTAGEFQPARSRPRLVAAITARVRSGSRP